MKDIFWQPAALLEQATGCRPWVSSVCAIVLVPFISGSLWHANGRIQQGCSRFLKVRCSNYCLLRSKDIERKAGKDQILPFPNIPKIPKQPISESFHQHPPTSTYIILHPLKSNIPTKQPQGQECLQVAHSLTQSPWVPQPCPCPSLLQPEKRLKCWTPWHDIAQDMIV